jgi:aminopeptidase 2
LITVTETSSGIHVRQDRFLSNGTPDGDENETLWFGIFASTREIFILFRNVPLGILTVDEDGQVNIDKTAFLEEREKTLAIDTGKNFKLNAGTVGFCEFHFPC